jgi:hypothetical protein
MKKLTLSILALSSLLCSCIGDDPETDNWFIDGTTEYEPIYMDRTSLEQAIRVGEPRQLQGLGKMYTYGNFIFLTKRYEGIHVIDNADPRNPINQKFIEVPGVMDVAVRGNMMYCDNSRDLITIDLKNLEDIEVTDRKRDFFPDPPTPEGQYADVKQYDGKMIVKWIKE